MEDEVVRIAKKMDKMVQKKNAAGALDLLKELKNIPMTLELLQSTRIGVCVIVVPFLLCYNYPVSDYYSPTRADTTTVVAAGAGVTVGFWINHFFQLVSKPTPSLPVIQNIPPITTDMLVLGLTKFMVGIMLILLVRQLVQNLSLQVLFSWFKVVTKNKEARRRLEIEVPYKFVTYTSVGICATTFVPMLHRFLGLL